MQIKVVLCISTRLAADNWKKKKEKPWSQTSVHKQHSVFRCTQLVCIITFQTLHDYSKPIIIRYLFLIQKLLSDLTTNIKYNLQSTYTVCPARYRTRHVFNNFVTDDIATTTDTFLFISHITNILLFKYNCNIFVEVRIIKEMPGSVASGTHCNFTMVCHLLQVVWFIILKKS